MNTTLACVFPETLPDAGLLFPLVQVFGQVVHMQAVENEPLETEATFVHRCREKGRLRTFTPAPLGEQRQRFMALVTDMQRHGADYTSQLSMLTLAGLHRGGEQRESTHALISDLLQRTDIREKQEEQLQLWQSRLMLKLGEWFDLQQTEIDTTLSHIASRQNALLQELREEDENPFSFTAGLGESTHGSEDMLRHRLKAWTKLCMHDQDQPQGILVTRHDLAMELLQEVYEKLSGQTASALLDLELPLAGDDDTPTNAPLISGLPALQELLLKMMEPLAAEQATAIAAQWANDQDKWQRLLDQHFPPEQAGRCRLELYYFPGISARRLFMEGFGGGMQSGTYNVKNTDEGCCIALLKNS